MKIYLIGSLRDKRIPEIANELREKTGHEVFDDWYAPGPRADDHWKEYETARGRSYQEALKGYAATHIFSFDKHHLDTSQIGILILPSGKSCHLEAGYMARDKPLYVLMDKPDRYDVMYQFATGIAFNMDELIGMINDSPIERSLRNRPISSKPGKITYYDSWGKPLNTGGM